MSSTEARALAVARSQHGLITKDQLLAAGFAERTLRRRVAVGLWVPMGQRVFRTPGTPESLLTRTRAVAMQCDSVLTGASAAVLLGAGPWDGVDLGTTPWLVGPRRRAVPARFITHPGISSRRVDGMRVAHRATAVIDLIRFLPPDDARTVACRAAQTGVITMDELTYAVETVAGLAGAAQLRGVAAELRTGARSEAELRLLRLLRRRGIRGWVANHPITLPNGRRAVLDVAFPEALLAIEVDGKAHHGPLEAFDSDRWRHNKVEALGWRVLHVTWTHLVRKPDEVIRAIRAALAKARAQIG